MEGLIFGTLRYVPWNDGIARQVQAPSHMFLLKVDYQLSFLKYLIHELVSQRHSFFLRPAQCILTSLCLFRDRISFREILIVIFHGAGVRMKMLNFR